MSMIILLGFDNTGKTTTAKRLADDLGGTHTISSGKGNKEEQNKNYWDKLLKSTTDLIVCDRFNIFEEQVYGPVLRGVSNFDFDCQQMDLLAILKPIIIYCRPSNEVIFNFGEREQMDGIISNKDKILEAYDNLFLNINAYSHSEWNTIVYDYTGPGSYNALLAYCKINLGIGLEDKDEY